MENKWAYLGLNVSWLLSMMFYYTGAMVCNRLAPTFEYGVVVGMTAMMGRILGIIGFIFLFIIIGNNFKDGRRKDKKRASN